MTNKLPVVGRKYKSKISDCSMVWECVDISQKWIGNIKEDQRVYLHEVNGYNKTAPYISDFIWEYEELPEDNLQESEKMQIMPVVGKRYNFHLKQCQENQPIFVKIKAELIDFEELPEDKAETKPETQSPELSPEVREAVEELRDDIKAWVDDVFGEFTPLSTIKPIEPKPVYETLTMVSNLLNALDKQFMSKEEVKIDTRQERVDSIKVNETSESVDVKEEEVKENTPDFTKLFLQDEDYGSSFTGYCSECRKKLGVVACKSNFKEGSFCSAKCANEPIKEESIWKPVSELPTNNAHCLVKCNDANKNHVFSAVFLAKEQAKGNKGFVDLAAQHLGGMNYSEEYVTLTDIINDYEKLKERVRKLEGK